MSKAILMPEVREYYKGYDVYFSLEDDKPVIVAANSSKLDGAVIDLSSILSWLRENKPEVLEGDDGHHYVREFWFKDSEGEDCFSFHTNKDGVPYKEVDRHNCFYCMLHPEKFDDKGIHDLAIK